jgi:hypothetical protein
MAVGDVAAGISQALSNYVQQERQRNRDAEDQQLDQHMQLIQALASRPDANPALLGQAIHDITQFQAAKGGRGARKGGMEGFMGAHELPISQFLTGFDQATRPIMGNTTEQVPGMDAQVPRQSLQMAPEAMKSGAAGIEQPPFPEPPIDHNLALTAAQVGTPMKPAMKTQPVAQAKQPYLLTPEAMAEQHSLSGAAGISANMEAEYNTLIKMGMEPEKAKLTVAEKYGLKVSTNSNKMGAGKIFTRTVNGVVDKVMGYPTMDMNGKVTVIDDNGHPMDPSYQPEETGASGQGPAYKDFTNKAGMITRVFRDGTSKEMGVFGKPQIPPRPYVYDSIATDGTVKKVAVDPFQLALETARAQAAARQAGLPFVSPQVLQKLQPDEQDFVDSTLAAMPAMNRVKQTLEQSGMKDLDDVSAWTDQRWKNFLYRMGFTPDQTQEALQQQVGYLKAMLLKAVMPGRPSQYIAQIFEQHLPDSWMTPARIYGTLNLVEQEIRERYAGIAKAKPSAYIPPYPNGPGGDMNNGREATDDEVQQFIEKLTKKPQQPQQPR